MDCVVGHPRSGTAYLANVLNAGGSQHCRHEYLASLSSMIVPLATRYYAGSASEENLDRVLDHYQFTPTPWVRIDSNWKLTWVLPVFLKRFPEARVVHLARDPRPNIRSCVDLDFYGDLHERPEFAKRRFWMSWMPDVDRPDWDRLSQFERNCAFWTETHRLALAALADHPRCHRVRVEDLHDTGERSRLYDFFDLPQPTRRQSRAAARQQVNRRGKVKGAIASTKGHSLGDHSTWPNAYREQFDELCGDMARRLGYSV